MKPTKKSMLNITRFTTKKYTYNGWRLCISRGGYSFSKYFGDRDYGSPESALEAAKLKRKEIYDLLASKLEGSSISTVKEIREVQGRIIKSIAEEDRKNVLKERGRI